MKSEMARLSGLVETLVNKRSDRVMAAVSVITPLVSIICVVITGYVTTQSMQVEAREKEKRDALLQALEVVDMVYANTKFNDMPEPKIRPWDIQKARGAVNKILVFCDDPEATITAFENSIGLHNPMLDRPRSFSANAINAFRREVARELGVKEKRFFNEKNAWIYRLPGTENWTDR